MNRFMDGVKYYTTGTAHIRVHFPEDQVNCRNCTYFRAYQDAGQCRCALTHELLYAPDAAVGVQCPIELDEMERER